MSIAAAARERISDALTRSVLDNPVVTKEFRTRMRGWKAFLVMGAYCLVMAAVLLIAYYFMSQEFTGPRYGRPFSRVSIGRDLFVALAWAQTILLTLIAPALSSGSLTQELERKTIEMVALSPLSAGRLVLGKQLADFMYTLILLVCSLPLAGITLMLGGISPAEIGITYALLAAWTFLLTCLGTMLSSLAKKTASASLASFGASIFYLFYASAQGGALLLMAYSGYRSSHMGLSPFMLRSPAYGPYGALEVASVCGARVPLALACFLLHIAYGVLFLLIASSHVLYKPAERALPIRLMLLGIALYTTWLAHGSLTIPPTGQAFPHTSIFFLAQMVIATFFLSTGVIRKPAGKPMLSYAFSWRKIFKSDVGGAILFMLLWVALDYACGALATYVGAKTQMMSIEHGFWIAYLHAGVSILAVVCAMAAVGVLCSSLAKTRGGAAGLLVLFAIVAFAGYGIISSYLYFAKGLGPAHPNPAFVQLAALWPVTPILVAGGQFRNDYAPTWIRSAWIVTSLVYVAIGAFALLLAGPAHAKFGGVREE